MIDRSPAARLRTPLLLVLFAGLAQAQAPEAAPVTPGGLWLSNVGIFGNYYSRGSSREGTYGAGGLRSDVALGGSATLNLMRRRDRSQMALEYTPSYSRRLHYNELDALNHSLLFHAHRSLAPRLRLGFSASGVLMTAEEFLFSPTRLSSLATRPGSAEDLADLLGGRSDAPGSAAAILTGSPEGDALSAFLLFGRRLFTSHAHTNLTYSRSARFSVSFDFDLGRTQHLSSAREGQLAVMPHVTTGTGSIGVSYSLSPRTTIGATAGATQHRSFGHRAYITFGRFTVERMLTQHWFAQGSAGAGAVTDLREASPSTRPGEFNGGGGLGYRLNSHTWVGSYDRRVGSTFGTADAGADSAGLTWNWFQPGSRWGISIGGNWHRMTGPIQIESWRGVVTLGKHLSRYTSMSVGFAYAHYAYSISGLPLRGGQYAVRTQFSWSPRGAGLF